MEVFNILNEFIAIIGSVFEFLLHELVMLADILLATAFFVGDFPVWFSWLPAQISSVLIIALTIAIIYKIAGREG